VFCHSVPHKTTDSRSITDPSRFYWSCQCQ